MRELAPKNIGVVAIDLPAHGDNKEKLTIENCLRDVGKTVAKLRKYKKPICFYGASFGGFVTLNYLITSGFAADRVLLLVPAVDLLGIHEKRIGTVWGNVLVTKEYVESIKHFDIMGNAKKLPPLDIVYAEKDSCVDNNKIFELAKVTKCNLYEIKGADHLLDQGNELDQVMKIALKCFA